MRRTGPRQVVPVVLAGLLLAGCGTSPSAAPASSTSPGSPPVPSASPSTSGPVLSDVLDATLGAGSARVQAVTRFGGTGSSASPGPTGTSEGVVDFATGNRQLLVPLPTGGRTETRRLDGVLYTQLPPGSGGRAASGQWLEVSLERGPGLVWSGAADHTISALMLLRGATGPLAEIGREQVRDAGTTHYRAELDLAEPSSSAGRASAEQGEAAALRLLVGDAPLPTELWIDDQQRIRRLQLALPGLDPTPPRRGAGGGASASISPTGGGASSTVEYYDFGVEVDVQLPPAHQIAAIPSVRMPGPPALASPSVRVPRSGVPVAPPRRIPVPRLPATPPPA